MMTTGHELRRALRGPLGRPAADAVSDAISGVQTCLQQDIDRVVGQIDRLRVVIIATGVAVFMGLSGVALAFVLLVAR